MEHAEGLDLISMYLANTGSGGSWVKGKRAWSDDRERRKPIMGFLLKLFWGEMSYWDDIPPKISKDELESLGACREG